MYDLSWYTKSFLNNSTPLSTIINTSFIYKYVTDQFKDFNDIILYNKVNKLLVHVQQENYMFCHVINIVEIEKYFKLREYVEF